MSRVISYHTERHVNTPDSTIHRARPYKWLDHTHWRHSLISHRKTPQLTSLDHASGSIGNHIAVLCRLPRAEYRISRTDVTRNIISHRRTRRHTWLDRTTGSTGDPTSRSRALMSLTDITPKDTSTHLPRLHIRLDRQSHVSLTPVTTRRVSYHTS